MNKIQLWSKELNPFSQKKKKITFVFGLNFTKKKFLPSSNETWWTKERELVLNETKKQGNQNFWKNFPLPSLAFKIGIN